MAEPLRDLLHAVAGDERQTWDPGVALNDFRGRDDTNSLLMQAWSRLPFAESANDPAA